MRIIQAGQEQIQAVMEVLSQGRNDLRRQGIYQWDEVYPNLDTVAQDVANDRLYVVLSGDDCLGAVSLGEEQEAAYQEVNWLGREPVLIIRRLCVAPAQQGRGLAARLMDFAEEFAEVKGYASIRLDVYTGNDRALRLYERRGYTVAGQVFFPRRELPFSCMEKILRPSHG